MKGKKSWVWVVIVLTIYSAGLGTTVWGREEKKQTEDIKLLQAKLEELEKTIKSQQDIISRLRKELAGQVEENKRLLTLCKKAEVKRTTPPKKLAKTLRYKTVAREDVSYAGTPRMTFRIVVETDHIPSEDRLKEIAEEIWENGNKEWKEFTAFMYLPDMDTKSVAYAVAEFRPYGLKEFTIQDYALYETKWKSLEEEKKTADEEWKKQKQSPEVKEYQVTLDVKRTKGWQIKINIKTNFPNGTNLHIWVYRTYYEKGKSEKYAGDIFSKDMTVKNGKIDLVVNVNDLYWYNEYYQKAKKFKGLIEFPGIGQISPKIEASVLFSPRRKQSRDVLKILGTNGEFVKGLGAKRTGNFTTYSVSKEVDIPFKK